MKPQGISFSEALKKAEHYCAYQERCHQEVYEKLKSFQLSSQEIDTAIVALIEHNFLNEERFACAFARGKHRIKKWGKNRIIAELKFRNICKYNIEKALKEITPAAYLEAFHELAEKHWENLKESNLQKKKKKFCDFMLRKGWESQWVYAKLEDFER